MTLVDIIAIAVGLALDATAVSIAASIMLGGATARQVFRCAFHFGLFQALMPVVGWFAGSGFRFLIAAWDHWVAFALLALIGGRAVVGALRSEDGLTKGRDPTRGILLLVLSIATSIDALAVGLSLAMLRIPILYPAAVIGLVTAAMSGAGMVLGRQIGPRSQRGMQLAGGFVLVIIGIKILFEHLVA